MSDWTIGFGWHVDSSTLIGIYLDSAGTLDSEGSLTQVGVSVQRYFSDADTAPFFRAALGYGWGDNGQPSTISYSDGFGNTYSNSTPNSQSGYFWKRDLVFVFIGKQKSRRKSCFGTWCLSALKAPCRSREFSSPCTSPYFELERMRYRVAGPAPWTSTRPFSLAS